MSTKWRKAIMAVGGFKEFIVPLIFAVWLIYQFIASYSLKQSDFDSLGSDGYARMIAGLGLFFIALYFVQKIAQIIRAAKNYVPESEDNPIQEPLSQRKDEKTDSTEKLVPILFIKTHYKLSMLVLCILYVFLIDKIGFIIASAIYLFISMLVFSDEKRKIWLIILLSVIFSVGIYYVFRYGFTILLP